jgi:hypothetical protein
MPGKRYQALIALAAAYAVVAHLFVTGIVGSARAGDAHCAMAMPAGDPGPVRHHGGAPILPDCCFAGCSMVAGIADLPATVAFATPPLEGPSSLPPTEGRTGKPREWSPFNPRGPPATA